jgi:hypothetical protein
MSDDSMATSVPALDLLDQADDLGQGGVGADARRVRAPWALIVAPVTRSPGFSSTGIDSPVSIDSSTADYPSTTSLSTGIFTPGRTRRRSPTRTRSTGTVRSSPFGQQARPRWPQLEEGADGARRPSLGLGLEVATEEEEGRGRTPPWPAR